ncbi:MAG: S9 family peptidase [Opitutus sp.]|nr:S9 family peptidase [Opitutus sp.]
MKIVFRLGLLAFVVGLPAVAQEPPKAPAEGTLINYLDRNSKEVGPQVARLTQEVFLLKTELIVSNFRQEYGDRIKMQRVSFAASTADKVAVPGYVFTPVGLAAGRKLPGLVMVHGGNHIQLTAPWFPWIAEAVRRGYAVIYPEYRGSSGHEETIYENSYGVTDLADVLAAAAYFSGKEFVDPARLGIFGHSRGGMLTMRAIETEPKRFKAAVEIAGVMDLVAFMSYKTDARRQDMASQKAFGGKLPNQNLGAYIGVSPAFFVEKIETPVLLLSTTGDASVPYQLHAKRVIEALKAYGKTYDEHLYELAPGGHEYLFVDSAEAHDSMKRTFEWFAKYLNP